MYVKRQMVIPAANKDRVVTMLKQLSAEFQGLEPAALSEEEEVPTEYLISGFFPEDVAALLDDTSTLTAMLTEVGDTATENENAATLSAVDVSIEPTIQLTARERGGRRGPPGRRERNPSPGNGNGNGQAGGNSPGNSGNQGNNNGNQGGGGGGGKK